MRTTEEGCSGTSASGWSSPNATSGRTLAIIPARGGSKGIPDKNLQRVGGVPLVARAIAGARDSEADVVIVSTDSGRVMQEALLCGAKVRWRPAELATDDADVTDAERDVLDALGKKGETYDYVLRLQPTSPFRTADDIDYVIAQLRAGRPAVVSVSRPFSHPFLEVEIGDNGTIGWDPRLFAPRQDYPSRWVLNGAIYGASIEYWRANDGFFGPETYTYAMSQRSGWDIDTKLDLEIARGLA